MKYIFTIFLAIITISLSACSLAKSGEIKNPQIPDGQIDIPLVTEKLEEQKTSSFKIFFPNEIMDPGFMDCSVVHPTERIVPYTVASARASLEELIKGPSEQEKSLGFQTAIDPNSRITSLSIKDGVAYVDFTKDLQLKNVGLCAGQFIQAQIEQTLLQFPTIKSVEISINGDKDFVQP